MLEIKSLNAENNLNSLFLIANKNCRKQQNKQKKVFKSKQWFYFKFMKDILLS